MKPKPVKRSKRPAYPTRTEFLAGEESLGGQWPWGRRMGKDLAGAAAMLLAANLTGCGQPPQPLKYPLYLRPYLFGPNTKDYAHLHEAPLIAGYHPLCATSNGRAHAQSH